MRRDRSRTHARRLRLLLVVAVAGGLWASASPPVGSAAPSATPLDLAAMVLRPMDLPGQPYGFHDGDVMIPVGEAVASFWASLGLANPEASGELSRRINNNIDQYADAASAQAAIERWRQDIAAADQDPASQRHSVDGAPVVGDDSVTTTFVATNDSGTLVNVMEIKFRTGNFVVALSTSDFGGTMPAFEEVAPLANVLVARIAEVQARGGTGLSLRALHVGTPDDVILTTEWEGYTHVDGVTLRFSNDTAEALQHRSELFAAARVDDLYTVQQFLDPSASGEPARQVSISSRIYMFANDADSAAYVDIAVGDVMANPGFYSNVAEVPVAGFSGPARAISYDWDLGGGQVASGFRVWAKSGTAVVSVEVDRIGGVGLQGVEQLALAQAACAIATTPCAPVPVPASL